MAGPSWSQRAPRVDEWGSCLQGYQPQKLTGLNFLFISILFYQMGEMETPSLGVVVLLKRVSPCKALEPCPATVINLLPF